MKATKKDLLRLGKLLRDDFRSGKLTGSFADRMEQIVLGYENSYKAQNGEIGITSMGRNLALWREIRP